MIPSEVLIRGIVLVAVALAAAVIVVSLVTRT